MTNPSTAMAPSARVPVTQQPWLHRILTWGIGYALPAFLATRLLLKLSSGALWLPPPWRNTVMIFGLLLGLACFSLARHQLRRLRLRAADGGEQGQGTTEDASLGREVSAQKHALAWYAAAVLLLAVHTFFRIHCVVPFEPSTALVHSQWGHVNKVERMDVDQAVFLEQRGGLYRGSILVPPRSWLTEDTQRMLRARHEHTGKNGLLEFVLKEPMALIDQLQVTESPAMWLTTLAFLFLHLGILCAASVGYGYGFSAIEELATQLPVG